MEVKIPTEETEPLLRQEITSSLQRPEDVYNNSVQNTALRLGDTSVFYCVGK